MPEANGARARDMPAGHTHVDCAHCGKPFVPHRRGHVFCSVACRHWGPRLPGDPEPADHDQVLRLFDESRDPAELVLDTEWHPNRNDENGAVWAQLDATDTVGRRRRWYRALIDYRGAV
jgi:hypothetical protein